MNKTSKRYWPSVLTAFYFLTLLFTLLLFMAGESLAANIRVPLDYPVIQKAIDAAKDGDTVQVSAGSYYEKVTMKEGVNLEGGWNKDFSKRDISANVTAIDGKKTKGWVVLTANNVTLDGFHVINASIIQTGDSRVGSGIHCLHNSVTIVNNTIKDNAPSGIYGESCEARVINNKITDSTEAGIYFEKKSSFYIQGNTIRNNKSAGVGSRENSEVSQIDARNNTIHDNGMAGIDARTAAGTISNNVIFKNVDAGIRIVPSPMEVINNTIVSNGRSGIIAEGPSSTPLIRNNIVTHNGESGIVSAGKGYAYNLLYANDVTGGCNPAYLWCIRVQYGGYEDEISFLKQKSIVADPLYVDASEHNYRLQPSSPAIDAGDPDSKFNDVNFGPSLGSPINDFGAYGGPLTIAEERQPNRAPQAKIVELEQLYAGDSVVLDGRVSSDPDGDSLSYEWTIKTKPEKSKAKISRAKRAKARMKLDKPGNYAIQLVVTDRFEKVSEPLLVKINALPNHPPVAKPLNIFPSIYTGDTVTLYGNDSTDADGDPLTYQWKILFKPSASRTVLSDAKADSPAFTIDEAGGYAVQLIVNDGQTDSEPATLYLSTRDKAKNNERKVPSQYPSIQSAIDAATDGDRIIVQKGVYKENLVIDRSVHMIGIDWPTVDGGSQQGDVNTIIVPGLGLRSARIEGFIITGGGDGGLGHGINIWDSAIVVTNNKIFGNAHVGLGVHGKKEVTSKTEVYNNHIYDNLIGVGTGRGSTPYIHDNHIYKNKMVGVGSRGLAAPTLKNNYFYENRIGVGCREVASPHIEGNHFFDNEFGISIGMIGTIKKYAGPDIIIKNNLIFNNFRTGIIIASFNASKIIISNNTIDSNNIKFAMEERGGGIVLGYPLPATFTAVIENNIITNNETGGIVNYKGTELFPGSGATIVSANNNVWKNKKDYLGTSPAKGDLSKDPLFTSDDKIKNGNYLLSPNSPCIDAGSDDATNLGMNDVSTRTDKAGDSAKVDIGYHYKK